MGLFEELMKRVSSKPRDVQLPNESGKVDPRLPNTLSNTFDAARGAIHKATKPFLKK
jgi:hypothetical protein